MIQYHKISVGTWNMSWIRGVVSPKGHFLSKKISPRAYPSSAPDWTSGSKAYICLFIRRKIQEIVILMLD